MRLPRKQLEQRLAVRWNLQPTWLRHWRALPRPEESKVGNTSAVKSIGAILLLLPLAAVAAPTVNRAGTLDGLVLLIGLIAILGKPRPRL